MKSLVEVQMPQNGINKSGIAALADAFAVNPNLKNINLNDNTFTKIGAFAMAKVSSCSEDKLIMHSAIVTLFHQFPGRASAVEVGSRQLWRLSRANERSNGACKKFSTAPKLEGQF